MKKQIKEYEQFFIDQQHKTVATKHIKYTTKVSRAEPSSGVHNNKT